MIVILEVPLNETPLIVLAFRSLVAVSAFPEMEPLILALTVVALTVVALRVVADNAFVFGLYLSVLSERRV